MWRAIYDEDEVGLRNLIKEANKNKILLNFDRFEEEYLFNKEYNIHIHYPLIEAFEKDIKIVLIIIDYANNHNIILNVNQKNYDNETPVIIAFRKEQLNKVRLLFE